MRVAIVVLFAGLMWATIGCGTITMSLDTEVGQDAEAVHSLSLSATGEMANLINQSLVEEDDGVLGDECQSDYSEGQFDIRCSGLTNSKLASQSSGRPGFDLEVVKSELPSHTEYRVSMPNPFWKPRENLKAIPWRQMVWMQL